MVRLVVAQRGEDGSDFDHPVVVFDVEHFVVEQRSCDEGGGDAVSVRIRSFDGTSGPVAVRPDERDAPLRVRS